MNSQNERETSTEKCSIPRTERILSVYHLFRMCKEVSYKEFADTLNMSPRAARRDILLLKQVGVLETRYDRERQAFIPVSLEPFPMEPQENNAKQKYMEKCEDYAFL